MFCISNGHLLDFFFIIIFCSRCLEFIDREFFFIIYPPFCKKKYSFIQFINWEFINSFSGIYCHKGNHIVYLLVTCSFICSKIYNIDFLKSFIHLMQSLLQKIHPLWVFPAVCLWWELDGPRLPGVRGGHRRARPQRQYQDGEEEGKREKEGRGGGKKESKYRERKRDDAGQQCYEYKVGFLSFLLMPMCFIFILTFCLNGLRGVYFSTKRVLDLIPLSCRFEKNV